jgi:hypothetical protein
LKVFSNADNENKGATVVAAPSDNVTEPVIEEETAVAEMETEEK